MRHPTDGTLRRLVDEPVGVADADRRHVAGCPDCLTTLATVRADAEHVHAALGDAPLAGTTDVETAWRRLSATVARTDRAGAGVAPPSGPPRRWRAVLRSPAVAVVGAVALLAGAGTAAANDWFQVFATEQVAAVSITDVDLVELPDLSAYGDVEVTEQPDVRQVADAAEAAEASGLDVPEVTALPRGVTGEPSYAVGSRTTVEFTFSAEKAAQAAEATGQTLPAAPDGLDGNTFRLTAGPGVATVWQGSQDVPALLVARAVAPTAFSSGLPFDAARDYLLSVPGIPDDLADQLRDFSSDGSTLPLPVPAGQVSTTTADVDGVQGTVITSRDGTTAGVVWVRDGEVTAVAGSLSADEVLTVARGLR